MIAVSEEAARPAEARCVRTAAIPPKEGSAIMSVFWVNDRPVEAQADQTLLVFLRETLELTSVKNGCSEGVCGTCTVLVDGRPARACLTRTGGLEGKHVFTCEGLSEREQAVYGYAFAAAGAVQCGFCTPGIIMSAVEIVGSGRTYTRDELRKLLSGHLCRCTGYENILNAVERAVYETNGKKE